MKKIYEFLFISKDVLNSAHKIQGGYSFQYGQYIIVQGVSASIYLQIQHQPCKLFNLNIQI